MFNEPHVFRRRLALLLTTSLCATASLPLWAADSPLATGSDNSLPAVPVKTTASTATPAKIQQVDTSDLINQLTKRVEQAEARAAAAEAAASQATATVQRLVAAQADSANHDRSLTPQADEASDGSDDLQVNYIPDSVKAQIREDLKQEVLTQAREENWATPRTFPDWVTRIKLFGDIRVRYEGNFYPRGNDNTGAFPNFNSINTGAPFDVKGNGFSPQYNVDQNRNRARIRARFGLDVDLGDGFTSGIRLATGENNSPVSQNQSLGAANSAQGGNFSKYSIWLDRAFLKYQLGGDPEKDLAITIGRFENPFFSSKMIWADELGFDGAVVQGKYPIHEGVTPFLTFGGFPVFNTDLNFSSTQPAKFKSEDKWLVAAQLGTDLKIAKDWSAKLGIAYYDFVNIEGKLSNPFTPLTAQDQGNTDDSRPAFAQRGNTYMALRNILGDSSNGNGTTNQWQYFGLATPFRELALTGRLDYSHFDPFHVFLIGEVVTNTAFNRSAINAQAVNNREAGSFSGGNTGWILTLNAGSVALENQWDWNVSVGYRYVESDATVDGFCDSEFGGGGTNLKGYTLGANLALSPRVWFGIRWMSADSIAGPTYKNDIIQFDLNAKF